jgi:ketosteroid isomerase-like protein
MVMAAGHHASDPNTHASIKGTPKMQSELDVIRGMYSAFARGDVTSVLAALAPQIVWIEAEGFPSAGTYTTPDAVLQKVFMRLATEWEAFGAVPHEFVCQGQTVVAIGDYSGTCRATGKAFKAPFAHVWKLRGGAVVGFQQFTDTAVVQQAMR